MEITIPPTVGKHHSSHRTIKGQIRVIVADGHSMFRSGLRKLFETEDDFRVIGEASTGELAADMARRLKPDVLLLDPATMPQPGFDALAGLTELTDSIRVIILTASIEKADMIEAFRLGARGIVLKEATIELLFKCLRAVVDGEYWIGRDGVKDIVGAMRDYARAPVRPDGPEKFSLTPGERKIIAAVLKGFANKEIATEASISERTVKNHLTAIFNKLGVSSRVQLTLFAIKNGLAE